MSQQYESAAFGAEAHEKPPADDILSIVEYAPERAAQPPERAALEDNMDVFFYGQNTEWGSASGPDAGLYVWGHDKNQDVSTFLAKGEVALPAAVEAIIETRSLDYGKIHLEERNNERERMYRSGKVVNDTDGTAYVVRGVGYTFVGFPATKRTLEGDADRAVSVFFAKGEDTDPQQILDKARTGLPAIYDQLDRNNIKVKVDADRDRHLTPEEIAYIEDKARWKTMPVSDKFKIPHREPTVDTLRSRIYGGLLNTAAAIDYARREDTLKQKNGTAQTADKGLSQRVITANHHNSQSRFSQYGLTEASVSAIEERGALIADAAPGEPRKELFESWGLNDENMNDFDRDQRLISEVLASENKDLSAAAKAAPEPGRLRKIFSKLGRNAVETKVSDEVDLGNTEDETQTQLSLKSPVEEVEVLGADTQNKTFLGSIKSKLAKLRKLVSSDYAMAQFNPKEFFNLKRNEGRRHAIIGLGMLAAAVVLTRGGIVSDSAAIQGGGSGQLATNLPASAGVSGGHPFEIVPGGSGSAGADIGSKLNQTSPSVGSQIEAHQSYETLSYSEGHTADSIWKHAEASLQHEGNAHPSVAQIAAEKNRILTLNHMTEAQAAKLQPGTSFETTKN